MDRDQLLDRIRKLTHPLSPIAIDHDTIVKPLYGIKCVAFDFYGTMFMSGVGDIGIDEDQQADSSSIFLQSLRETNLKICDDEAGERAMALFKEIIGNYISAAQHNGVDYPEPEIREIWREILTKLLDEHYIKGPLSQETATHLGIEFEFRINNIWPMPNLESTLQSLLALDMELGIISNSQFYTPYAFEATMNQSLESIGFNPNLLIWSFQVGRKKPSPHFYELFVHAASHEGLKPEQVLYIGNDIQKDIRPAKSLKMKTALFVGDQRSIRHERNQLTKPEYRPDLIIDNLQQIPGCLKV